MQADDSVPEIQARCSMAISHICLACGLDLARVRLSDDPHYGLPLIICPQCCTVSVRRRPLAVLRWRQTWRAVRTLLAMLLQLALLGGLTALTMALCMTAAHELAARRIPGPTNTIERIIFLGVVIGLSVGIGAWLTVGLAHWRRWIAWLSFFAWTAVLMAMDVLIGPFAVRVLAQITDHHLSAPFRPEYWIIRLALLAAMMIVATLGIPVGMAIRHGWRAFRRQRWRARRRRLRGRRNV